MIDALYPDHEEKRRQYAEFVSQYVAPFAGEFDLKQKFPIELIRNMGRHGLFKVSLSKEQGGDGTHMINYGILNEEIGKACSSTRGLLTVQNMLIQSLVRWGSKKQKEAWLPGLLNGEIVGAFCLTEPECGSDAKNITTEAEEVETGFVINGAKKWITFGQLADVYLVFAKCRGKMSAFLVDRKSTGVKVKKIQNMLGMKAGMLAQINFNNCFVSKDDLLGKIGFGFAYIMSNALLYGRYSVACGSVGLAQACLNETIAYTKERKQFGDFLKNYQMVQAIVANMHVNIKAARNLCYQAGIDIEKKLPTASSSVIEAKYYAAKLVNQVAHDAVQMHGANGCSNAYKVERYFRDAKIQEIIEGSNELLQQVIAQDAYRAIEK